MLSKGLWVVSIVISLAIPACLAGAVATRFPSLVPTPEVSPVPEGYVAAADLFNALSASWAWDPVLGRLEVVLPTGDRLVLIVDSKLVRLGERLFRLEDPVRFIQNRLMVPERLIADVLEPALGHPIRLPTPTPEPVPVRPAFTPTPTLPIEIGPPLFHEPRKPEPLPPRESGRLAIHRFSVVLDPSHGGEDKGSIGIGLTTEAQMTLSVARLCEESLETNFDIDVSLTRRDDIHLSSVERVTFANGLGAQAFVSLHAGGLFDPKRSIPSVFFLIPPAAEGMARGDVSGVRWWDQRAVQSVFVPWELGSAAWSEQSRDLAEDLHDALLRIYKDVPATDLEDGARPARLAILRGLLMPGVLVELGSLSNLEAEQLLRQEGFQRQLAESLALAIGNWVYRQQGWPLREMIVP